MTTTIFDHLLTGANESGEYPIIQNEYDQAIREDKPKTPMLDRVQIQLSDSRFAILVRHYKMLHWGGYVKVDQLSWFTKQHLIRPVISPRVSYADYGNEYITWMRPNAKGRLSEAVQITPTPDLRGDFWVGFHTRQPPNPYVDVQTAMNLLYAFEEVIRRFME